MENTLKLCEEIKNKLVDYFEQLKDITIEEMKPSEKGFYKYAGYCHNKRLLHDKSWVENGMKLVPVEPGKIKLKLRKQSDIKSYLSMDVLTPVLLHEFAHAIAPVEVTVQHHEYHGAHFYKVFSSLLDQARKLGIYKLTFNKGKYSTMEELKRLDKLLNEDFVPGIYDYKNVKKSSNEKIKIILHFRKKEHTIYWSTEEDLFEICKKALNISDKYKIVNKKKESIDIEQIKENSHIYFTKA